MSTPTQAVIPVPCPYCLGSKAFQVDISGFHVGIYMPLDLTCPGGHHIKTAIKGGKMMETPSVPVHTNIHEHVDVPQKIRDTIWEANRCFGIDAPLAGACLVRTALDMFLHALGFTDRFTGAKVTKLEEACDSGSHANLAPRIQVFRAICDLAGQAIHAPASNRPLFTSEWMTHLSVVEGAVKQNWPNRVSTS